MYFIPPRLLKLNIQSISIFAIWTEGQMGSGDPWVNYPYQWRVVFSVTPQIHSCHLTPTPFYYNGNDVVVGDWIADLYLGLSVKIITIVSQNANNVTAICEDVDRFNTFTDPTGQGGGIGSTGDAFLFTLNDEGLPILAPMTSVYTALRQNLAWQQDQIGRFQYRNYSKTYYRVHQPNHNFVIGDILTLGTNTNSSTNIFSIVYKKVVANSSAITSIVGQVSSVGSPGPYWFTIRPNGRIVTSLSPVLPGLPGDLIYLTTNGLSNVAPNIWTLPLFIQMENSSVGISLNRSVDISGGAGFTTKSYIVPDITTSNALQSKLNNGDQVMVDDAGSGKWAQYIYKNNAYRTVVTQDASNVDAETLTSIITPSTIFSNVITINGTRSSVFIGNVSANRTIAFVNVAVTTAFAANATLLIGTPSTPDIVVNNSATDLTNVGSYNLSPEIFFSTPNTSLYAFVNYNGIMVGNATISITYV